MEGKYLTLLKIYLIDYSTAFLDNPASIRISRPEILLELHEPVFENRHSNSAHQTDQIMQVMQAHQAQAENFVAPDQMP